jgi:hypothetical protein
LDNFYIKQIIIINTSYIKNQIRPANRIAKFIRSHFKTSLELILRSFVQKRLARVCSGAQNFELFEGVSPNFLRRRRISVTSLALYKSRKPAEKGF